MIIKLELWQKLVNIPKHNAVQSVSADLHKHQQQVKFEEKEKKAETKTKQNYHD